ncbi:amino acid adenylation domain-containing protein [Taibaiella chishuiensis]|uniref:Amino acid adenylation domain-containing protein n=1 Tax=Taibaiella chishuiensis TaxID=1434707 RepID=A0A2P8CZN9_9BACT|nr:non-ribosomal peptide synthetase [Taibaiella chishuiensis]PSK90431.1 amino acid adenylation domain-containing protein [Taibaiella chishuiensis]
MNKALQHKIALDYWLEKTGRPGPQEIRATAPATLQHAAGASLSFPIGQEQASAIKKISNDSEPGIYLCFLAAFHILVYKYTAAEYIRVASPAPLLKEAAEDTGTMFLVAMLSHDTVIRDLLLSLQRELKESYHHKQYDGDKFRQQYQALYGAYNSLFTYALSYEPLTGAAVYPEATKLSFHIRKTATTFELEIQYAATYDSWFIRQLGAHFMRVLSFLTEQPGITLSEIRLLLPGEHHLLIETFNDTTTIFPGKDKTVSELFEQHARQYPQQEAVRFGRQMLSYSELQQRSLQVARYLREQRKGPGSLVALVCGRSEHMIAGMLGIWKAGAAYVPVDADLPDDRINYILQDSGSDIIVTTWAVFRARPELFKNDTDRLFFLDERTREEGSLPAPDITVSNDPGDPAYVIYTSGSTGKPKGVVVMQHGLTNFLLGYKSRFKNNFGTGDRVLALANIAFDASIAEIFVALTSGATLVVLDKDQVFDAAKLAAVIREEAITYTYIPPVLLKDVYTCLKPYGAVLRLNRLFVGVEAIRDNLLYDYSMLIPGLDIVNAYGPTETTVMACMLNYKPETPLGENVAIGTPLPNYRIYILDDRLDPVPLGVPGELCIAGAGVSKGYLNNEALSQDKFVPDPFGTEGKMYRSGDMACRLPDGNIVFIGRKDNQVKIRGHRVEPGEVESALLGYALIREAVVVAFDDDMGSKYLCAYFVPESPGITIAGIRAYLSGLLPEYMIPARFVTLDKIPVTSNGKTDRSKLPRPENAVRRLEAQDEPANEQEAQLVDMWRDLLQVSVIGVNDNFFELGGHSLKAAKLITMILRDFQVEIPLREMFSCGTVRKLAGYIQKAEKTRQFEIPIAPAAPYYPNSFTQTGIYLSWLLNRDAINYNIPSAFLVSGNPDIPRLEAAFRNIIERHAVLRTGFRFIDDRAVQYVTDSFAFGLPVIQAQGSLEAEMARFVRPFDLAQPPLIRVAFIQTAEAENVLLIDVHHIVSDGLSIDLLIKEIIACYTSAGLPALTIQYKDYAVWLEDYRTTAAFERHRQHWLQIFSERPKPLNLPFDFPRPEQKSLEGGLYRITLNKETVARLKHIVRREESTLFLLTLTAYNLLLAYYTGESDIVIGTPVAGRIHPDLDHLIGMFVHTLPVRSRVTAEQSFAALMGQVKQTFFEAMEHQLYPMDELAEQLELERSASRNHPLFDTLFAFQNIDIQALELEDVALTPLALNYASIKFDLTVDITESDGELLMLFNYAESLFREETIVEMAGRYLTILETIAQAPDETPAARGLLPANAIGTGVARYLDAGVDQQALFEYLDINMDDFEVAYPLTTTQRDIYLTSVREPAEHSMRLLVFFEIRENIDIHLWEQAIARVTAQEAVLRSVVVAKDAMLFQAVQREMQPQFSFINVNRSETAASSIGALVKEYGDEDQDVRKPPFRHYLFCIGDAHYVTAVSAHHLFMDGTSSKLLLEQIDRAYQDLRKGISTGPVQEPYAYRDYVFQHLSRFDTPAVQSFWEKTLKEVQPLSYAGALSTADNAIAGRLLITAGDAQLITKYCKQWQLKPPVFFKAIFALLTRYYCTADQDFCIRENRAGRSPAQSGMPGVLSYCFPMLIAADWFTEALTFPGFCSHLQQQQQAAQAFRYISLSLQDRLIGAEPLSFFYNYQPFIIPGTVSATGPLQQVYHILDNQVELRVRELEATFELKLDYNERIFNGSGFLDRVYHVMMQVLQQEDKQLHDIQYLKMSEIRQLSAFGTHEGAAETKNILELFEEQVQAHPGNIALVFGDTRMTYAGLHTASDTVAAWLQNNGIGAGDIVALMLDRSEWMVIGLLGVLKSGAAYLPVDPGYPAARIAYLLQDSQAKMVLVNESLADKPEAAAAIEQIAADPATHVKQQLNPGQLAYLIYTSGTTGEPKGVMMEHGALANIAGAWRKAYQLDRFELRLLQMASFSFDVFTGDVIRALTNGGRLVICPAETRLDVPTLYGLIIQHGINILESTPALVLPLMDYVYEFKKDISCLKLLILGSDSCPAARFRSLLERFAPVMRIINSYGVTEACIDSGFYETEAAAVPASGNTPIGKPLQHYHYYVCDSGQRLLPVGVPGELWIGGAGIARGYWHKAGVTAARFIPDPFGTGRVYKTGDRVRWLPDGNLEFLGRNDDQVKIRGFRIELAEIESVLLREPQVRDAVVTVYGSAEDQELIGWYTGVAGMDTAGLTRCLKEQLPAHMVPAHLIRLEQLPVTANGKVDRKALPDPLHYLDQKQAAADMPATATETSLLDIWKDILKRKNIGISDNFFESGGQSLRAMILVSRIQKIFAVEISLKDIFSYPTVHALAKHIDQAMGRHFSAIKPVEQQDYYPLSSAQKRIYVISHFKGAETSYNMYAGFWINGALDIARLEAVFQQLIDRHESLRTAFVIVEDKPVQVIREDIVFRLKHSIGKEEEAGAVVAGFIRKFDLSQAPLFRAEVLEVAPDRHLLMFDLHHIIGDGVSMHLFIQEVMAGYQGIPLPGLNIQYKDFAAWQQSLFTTGAIQAQQQFWEEQFKGSLPVLDLPADFPRPLTQTFEGSYASFDLDPVLASELIAFTQESGVTLNMFLLAVYNILLSKYSAQEDIIVGTAAAGRNHADLEPLIGMFVNTLALRHYPKGEKQFRQFLQEVKDNALATYENQDYPFEELVDALNLKRDTSRNPLFDTMFLYADDMEQQEEPEGWDTEPFSMPGSVAKMDLIFEVSRLPEQIKILINYNTALFTAASVERWIQHYVHIVRQVLADPAVTLRDIVLPDEEECQLLSGFGGVPEAATPGLSLPVLWAQQVKQRPGDIIIETRSHGSLSFAEMDRRSDALAACLVNSYGVQPGDRVVVMLPRTPEVLVSHLAIMKAGAAFVPVDPYAPAHRRAYILENSGACLVVSDRDQDDLELPVLNLHKERERIKDGLFAAAAIDPGDLAYIIYTSGSTGNPKGVMMEHGNVVALNQNMESVFGIKAGDKLLALANLTFDMSILDTLCCLASGVCIVLADDHEANDLEKITELITQHGVTVLQSTPSRLQLLFERFGSDWVQPLKKLIVGGEAMPEKLFRILRNCKNTRVFNAYGPTETCVWSSVDEMTDERITIGVPLKGDQVLILDAQGQVQPLLVPGEICIGGAGVGRGYCGNEALTNAQFIRNEQLSTGRIYKTGDTGRWLPDGRIEYIGRIDNQVKLRGYRIELGEIENALCKQEGIKMAAAIIAEINGEKQIVTFYESDREYNYATLRALLADHLPGYMLPLFCIYLQELPLTSSRKIDRMALEALAQKQQAAARPYEAPAGALEKHLAGIWKEILELDQVSVTDNFFEIGGNSIRLIQVLNRVKKEMEVTLPLTTAFTYPTVRELAVKIKMIAEYGQVSAEDFYSVVNPGRSKTIFCFPPAIGYSFAYAALGEYLPDYTLYCFHFVEQDNRAEVYLDLVNKVQPGDPVLLLGYSAGGNFAFEMAKAFEAQGREVSDIILIDSYKTWVSEVKTPEELAETIRVYFESIDWSLFSVEPEYLETIRKTTRDKISAYCRHMDGKTDSGVTNARIHVIKSKEEWDKPEVNRYWEESTTRDCYVLRGGGLHIEMLYPEYLAQNAGLIASILQQEGNPVALRALSQLLD